MSDRFVTDSSLERIARRLRLLGFDIAGAGAVPLEQLFAAARRDDRIVLTTSVRHPRRFAGVRAFRVPREPSAAVRAVVGRFRSESAPFRRCSVCNGLLETRSAAAAAGQVPEAVRQAADTLDHCGGCGRWYWSGTHVERLRAWLAAALVGGTETR